MPFVRRLSHILKRTMLPEFNTKGLSWRIAFSAEFGQARVYHAARELNEVHFVEHVTTVNPVADDPYPSLRYKFAASKFAASRCQARGLPSPYAA